MKQCNPKVVLSLKKARSHIDKIITMVENGEYCIDVLQQLNAVIGYLRSAKNEKLSEHLNTCFAKGMSSKSVKIKNKLIEEVIQVTKVAT
ncbi:MAG: metal-sensing transcriptional repressor [Candidatus Dojkabacteria bacterium]|jgi:DNA-binding FrmR family transcriptional regulator|nr:metal-sensing transcriptional repressor [Candidatus Dojkabacteria bacterium]